MPNTPDPRSPVPDRQSRPDPGSPIPDRPRRGGPRPGAGAPRGNMNALKHGAYSRQFALVGKLMAEDPKIRDVLLDMGRRRQMKQRRAQTIAAALFTAIIKRAEERAGGPDRLNLPLPVDDWDSINRAVAEMTPGQLREAIEKIEKSRGTTKPRIRPRKNNQTPGSKSP